MATGNICIRKGTGPRSSLPVATICPSSASSTHKRHRPGQDRGVDYIRPVPTNTVPRQRSGSRIWASSMIASSCARPVFYGRPESCPPWLSDGNIPRARPSVGQHGPSSRGSRGNSGLDSDLESVTYRFHDILEGSTPTSSTTIPLNLACEFDERKKGWKRCGRCIFASRTLGAACRRKYTGRIKINRKGKSAVSKHLRCWF
jgi:hypothetical protein